MPQIQEEAYEEAMGEYKELEGRELRERAVSVVSAGRSMQDAVSRLEQVSLTNSQGSRTWLLLLAIWFSVIGVNDKSIIKRNYSGGKVFAVQHENLSSIPGTHAHKM